MKININEFRNGTGQMVDAPLDFSQLCAALSALQAATPTAQLANAGPSADALETANPAVKVLRQEPGWESAAAATHGSFHAAAAARFNSKTA